MTSKPLPIDPELYRSVLQQIKLREINLRKLRVDAENAVTGDVHIDVSTDVSHVHECNELQIDTTHKIEAHDHDSQEKSLFSIEVTFRLHLSAPEKLPEGFVDVYIAHNLSITVFPYVREIVASITSRMGLPTLTLPYIIDQASPTKNEVSNSVKAPRKAKAKKAKPQGTDPI